MTQLIELNVLGRSPERRALHSIDVSHIEPGPDYEGSENIKLETSYIHLRSQPEYPWRVEGNWRLLMETINSALRNSSD
jgi:hypothetical protein